MPAIILALTLCISIAMIAGCAGKDVTFKGHTDNLFGNTPADSTIVLKSDKTCEFTIVFDTELEFVKNMEAGFKATGTWKMENDQYVVTLTTAKEGSQPQTITSTSSGSVYTLTYSIQTEGGARPLTLTYNKDA